VPPSVIQRSVEDAPDVVQLPGDPEVDEDSGRTRWAEAVMLWLSWNSTYEKVTQRMYQDNKNPEKLQALMDEMDQLRRRAVVLSEELIA
jgi:hypothetical protein